MISLKKNSKIIVGIGMVLFGIIGMFMQPSLILSISSLISVPSGMSLIISAVT